jgi:hypothetical protein
VVLPKNELDSALKKLDEIVIVEIPKVIPPLKIIMEPVTQTGILALEFSREIKINRKIFEDPARELAASQDEQDKYMNKMLERAFDIRYLPSKKEGEEEDEYKAKYLGFSLIEFKDAKKFKF